MNILVWLKLEISSVMALSLPAVHQTIPPQCRFQSQPHHRMKQQNRQILKMNVNNKKKVI